jgi:hypothetical protein
VESNEKTENLNGFVQKILKSDPSVLQSVKGDLLETKPKRLFKTLVDQAGGPLHTYSLKSHTFRY